jgi:hypothetical protein
MCPTDSTAAEQLQYSNSCSTAGVVIVFVADSDAMRLPELGDQLPNCCGTLRRPWLTFSHPNLQKTAAKKNECQIDERVLFFNLCEDVCLNSEVSGCGGYEYPKGTS